jgi:RsiW-degrading membrane proteinase PrsW (M82 family)
MNTLAFLPAQTTFLLHLGVYLVEILLTFGLILYIRTGSRGQQEPWKFFLKIIIYGGITALISAFVEIKYSFNIPVLTKEAPQLVAKYGQWYAIINNISASLIEELAKYMVAVFCIIDTRHFHKMSDAIIYMILIGLGFSLVEDALYFLNPQTDAPYRLLSFFMHSGTSAIVGYSLGRFKFGLASYRELAVAIFGAVTLHFAYNLSTSLNDFPTSFYLTILICIYITLQIFILFHKAVLEEYQLEHNTNKNTPASRLLNLRSASQK